MRSFATFLIEGAPAGKLDLIHTSPEQALAFAHKQFAKRGRDLEEEYPDFVANYKFAQTKAHFGKTLRKDMPRIRDHQVKEFQMRLMGGFIDIRKPFAATTNPNNPFPGGLSGESAAAFMEAGLKIHDGSATDDKIRMIQTKVAVKDFKPIQKQIYPDNSIKVIAKEGVLKSRQFLAHTTFFILSGDNYVIDGHHRMLSAILTDPDLKVNAMKIDLPIKKLLPLATAFGDAIGNKRNH
jgi:hypothetical protein